jgi:hypothetical protein
MTPYVIFSVALLAGYIAGRRSLLAGLSAVLVVGYLYGITRANFLDTFTHLSFDAAVIGLYGARLFEALSRQERARVHDLRLWVVALIAWPTFLFAITTGASPLVELVGWRANVFLLPFLLLGARLSDDELYDLARVVAVLNIGAVAVAAGEFTLGVERFFPVNEVTEIIFKSRDLVGYTAYRIPATFSSAHAYAGTMVLTLPLLLGAFVQRRDHRWHLLLGIAIAASLLGVFMAAARIHTVVAGILVLVTTFVGGMRGIERFRWLLALALVVWIVGGDARLQRFSTLRDTQMVTERIGGSVNETFFDVVGDYPLGNGLASGGTSVPFFLLDEVRHRPNAILENEYARLALELGWPGLVLWLGFIGWVLARGIGRGAPEWRLMRRLTWVVCLAFFLIGLIGIGMLSSVPQASIMLILIGWMTARRASSAPAWQSTPAKLPVAAA